MNLRKISRPFYEDEARILSSLLKSKKKELNRKPRYYYLVIAIIIAAGCTYGAVKTNLDVIRFLLGTIAVFLWSFTVFTPYEIYKQQKKLKSDTNRLQEYVSAGIVCTYPVSAKRIALAKKYEDESDLYIIEIQNNNVICLWDREYNLNKKFPCLNFEIYDEDFTLLTGRQVYQLSEKIKPILIAPKAKWNYMIKNGVPENLQIISINFDKLIEKINYYNSIK